MLLVQTGYLLASIINLYPCLQVTAELDESALILARMYGLGLIGSALVWLLTRETLDGTVPITLITSRVFVSYCKFSACSVPYMSQ